MMKRLPYLLLLLAFNFSLFGQLPSLHQSNTFIFNSNNPVPTGNHIFEAVEYNDFQTGSEYSPTLGKSLEARINPYLLFPPPGDTTGGPNPGDNGVVGTLSGSSNISPTGGFSYSIPLDLPAGILNMAPNLALTYNSQSGAGMLGLGWTMTGLSSINRTGTNLYNDNYISCIDFNQDKFALDGNRMMAINNGTYGNPGTEYRTELETFSKIISYGTVGSSPASFKVWSKDGRVWSYGVTEDSRIRTNDRPDVLTWLLSKVEDLQGNFISYTYTPDLQYGDFRLQKIEYTGNQAQTPFYSINFDYEIKPDLGKFFVGGAEYKNSHRLTDITLKYQGTFVRNYHISYYAVDGYYSQSNTVNSLVKSITIKGKDNKWFNPTQFTYTSSGNPVFSADEPWLSNSFCTINDWDRSLLRLMGDINGDGKADIVGFGHDNVSYSFSGGTFFNDAQQLPSNAFARDYGWDNFSATPIYLADINGDGMDDIVGFGHEDMAITLANGTGFDDVQTIQSYFCEDDDWHEEHLRSVTDINGDGRADIVAFGVENVFYQLSTGTGFGPVVESINAFGTNFGWGEKREYFCWETFEVTSLFKYPRFLVDVNGDGLKDILGCGSDHFYVAFAKSDPLLGYEGFDNPVEFNYPDGYYHPWIWQYPKCSADINDDGKCDLIMCFKDKVYYYLSNGYGFEPPQNITNPNNIFCVDGGWTICAEIIQMTDNNGDGKADLCGIGENGIYVAISNGTGFEPPQRCSRFLNGS